MPKIVIREIDNTEAGSAAYANFAVVVPGFVREDEYFTPNMAVFDENGVYECKSQDEFFKHVGLTSSTKHKVADATAPTRASGWDQPKALTSEQFDEEVKAGNLYVAEVNATGEYGQEKDKEFDYSYASAGSKSMYSFKPDEETTEGTFTQFMKLDTVGNNEIFQDHYGNQIAYELLGLGYTVLYKYITNKEYLAQKSFWNPLKDKTMYDFRYLMSGLLNGNAKVYANMVDVATFAKYESTSSPGAAFDDVDVSLDGTFSHGRGDCIALLDIDEAAYVEDGGAVSQEKAIEKMLEFAKSIPNSKYAAAFAPTVKYTEGSLSPGTFGGNRWFPASFHYLACAARSSERYSEWYANAGYARGVSGYTIEAVGCKFGEAAVNIFQRRKAFAVNDVTRLNIAINPIINLRGAYYLWGNRTTFELGDPENGDLKASHFLNIRQLCSTIKKKVYVSCRQLTFDPNSDILWIKFCNSIKPMLEKMKADQGIADYKISRVKSNRKAFMSAVIKIVPIEAVEDFDISIHLEDSLEGIIATAEE
jgi:hypothetical protein